MATKEEILVLALLRRIRREAAEFQRKVDEHFAKVDARFVDLRREMVKGFDRLDAGLDGVDMRLEARLESLHSRTTMGFQQIIDEIQSWRSIISGK